MRGVAADEDAAVAEAVGHEAAADPVLLAEDLVLEVGAHAEDLADCPVAVDGLEVVFAGLEVVVQQPSLAPVDGVDVAAAARVEREGGPGWPVFRHAQQRGRASE